MIALSNFGRIGDRFVRRRTARVYLVFCSRSVLKAGLCPTGLDRATTCLFTCKVACRKNWQPAAIRAVLTVNPGRPERSEILPRRL